MSPKHSSLAFDEVQEQSHMHERDADFQPELNLLVKTRSGTFVNSSADIIRVGGRVTVSF